MKIEWHWKPLGVLLSFGGMYACRHHPWALLGVAIASLFAWVWALGVFPKRLQACEQRRLMSVVRLCDAHRLDEAERAAHGSWWLRLCGHVYARCECIALVAQASGQYAKAESALLEALDHACDADRPRLELNLAKVESLLGKRDQAMKRVDRILRAHPDLHAAVEKMLPDFDTPSTHR